MAISSSSFTGECVLCRGKSVGDIGIDEAFPTICCSSSTLSVLSFTTSSCCLLSSSMLARVDWFALFCDEVNSLPLNDAASTSVPIAESSLHRFSLRISWRL
ncbi:hypothetical protein V8G54_010748 [Vigna mungo]|uniref:Uncharacterized protein n=1 Tax=Vigna mungo TaxID=3915 RepID=A0AAQ3NZ32_VIGMU